MGDSKYSKVIVKKTEDGTRKLESSEYLKVGSNATDDGKRKFENLGLWFDVGDYGALSRRALELKERREEEDEERRRLEDLSEEQLADEQIGRINDRLGIMQDEAKLRT